MFQLLGVCIHGRSSRWSGENCVARRLSRRTKPNTGERPSFHDTSSTHVDRWGIIWLIHQSTKVLSTLSFPHAGVTWRNQPTSQTSPPIALPEVHYQNRRPPPSIPAPLWIQAIIRTMAIPSTRIQKGRRNRTGTMDVDRVSPAH